MMSKWFESVPFAMTIILGLFLFVAYLDGVLG